MDFKEAFQQTTPLGFMNTGTLAETPENLMIIKTINRMVT
jgi:hypothetical protein